MTDPCNLTVRLWVTLQCLTYNGNITKIAYIFIIIRCILRVITNIDYSLRQNSIFFDLY